MIEEATSGKKPKKQKLTKEEKQVYNKAFKYYEDGEYKEALSLFQEPLNKERLNERDSGAYYYIKFCRNVLNTSLSKEDEIYEKERTIRRALGLLWIPIIILLLPLVLLGFEEPSFSFLSLVSVSIGILIIYVRNKIATPLSHESSYHKLRCKYCGHYTNYTDPNEGYAYMGSNNCDVCGRGYPMPSGMWDTDWGKSYIYERGSVTEPEFYREWEEENPSYVKSKMADHYLGRKERKKKKNAFKKTD